MNYRWFFLRNRIWTQLLVFLLCVSLFATRADAQISVNDVILHFGVGERPLQNVIVSNSSNEAFAVTVTVERFVNPDDPKSEFEPAEDLLVSPKKFSIDARGQRTIRLLLKKSPVDREIVYRVLFTPKAGGFDDAVELKGSRRAFLKVVTGMGILVFADPPDPHPDLTWTRVGDKLIFRNAGNVHVRIMDGKSCEPDGKQCIELPTKRVYGGTTYEVTVPRRKIVSYTKRNGSEGAFQKIEIPPAP